MPHVHRPREISQHPIGFVPSARRQRRNPDSPKAREADARSRAESALRSRVLGSPDAVAAEVAKMTSNTPTAEVIRFLGALLDLHDPRLIERAKDEMAARKIAKATSFNELVADIEKMRREEAAESDRKARGKAAGFQIDAGLGFKAALAYGRDVIRERNKAAQGPDLYLSGNAVVALAKDPDSGVRSAVEMTADGLTAYLTRHGDWRRKAGDTSTEDVEAPPRVAVHLLADPEPEEGTYPRLDGIVTAPVFGPDGRLILVPGYDRASRLYYAPPRGFTVPEIAAEPSADAVAEARRLLVSVFADMPFAGGMTRGRLEAGAPCADLAHIIAWMLTPLIRPMLGPSAMSPALLIAKPSFGAGASLALKVAQLIVGGTTDLRPSLPRRDDEMHKEAVAALRSERPFLCIDNATTIGTGPLAALLTSPVYSGRTLGRSETRSYPNRLSIAFTGANPVASRELQRRLILCWLDPQVEAAHERGGFKHPDLEAHVAQHRGQLYGALCTLVAHWIATGGLDRLRAPADAGTGSGPASAGPPVLASYIPWSLAVGGILSVAGIGGFLTNKGEVARRLTDVGDADDAGRDFILAWLADTRAGRTGQLARDLAEMADRAGLDLDVKKGPKDSGEVGFDSREFGKWLHRIADRVVDVEGTSWRVGRSEARTSGGFPWSLTRIEREATPVPVKAKPRRRGARGFGV